MAHSRIALVALVALLPSCASVVKGTSQSIAVTTPPTDGALCTLSSGQGNWQVTSPGAVTVQKSKEDMQVRCAKGGWRDGFATIPSNFEGWTVGNILIGGIIGLGIDAATGAVNEYPHAFQVPMVAEGPAMAPPPAIRPPVGLPPPMGKVPGV